MTSPNRKPTAVINAANIEDLREQLFGPDSPILALSAKVTANQTRDAERFASVAESLADMAARIDTFKDDLMRFVGRTDVPPAVKHRKHTALAAVVKDLKLRMAQLESMDRGSPDYIEAVNAEIVRLNGRIDTGYADLEGRLAVVEGLSADHGMRLDLIDPTLAAHTTMIEEVQGRVTSAEADLVSVRALASAKASATRGRDNWPLGIVTGIVSAIVVGLIFRHWVDASTTVCWVATGFGFVGGFLAGSSFPSPGDMAASASAGAGFFTRRRTVPTPPAEPAPPALPAGSNPPTTPVPVIVPATASASAST